MLQNAVNTKVDFLHTSAKLELDQFVSQTKIDEAMAIVDSLNFELQIKKMIEYNGLDSEYVYDCIKQYKNFLAMLIAYKNSGIDFVPNSMIDEAWHQHILDTKKYAEDCMLMFGEFKHHYPYFGLRGEDDVKAWKKVSKLTEEVYKHHFGCRIYDKDGNTGRGCSSQSCW